MPTASDTAVDPADLSPEAQQTEALLKTGALQKAIFNSANFSSIATDATGVIQIFNVGAERMLGYAAAGVVNTMTAADIHDPQEVIARAAALSIEFGTPIAPGFEALVFKAARGIEDIYELTKVRKDGSRFPAVVSVTALRNAEDAIIGYLLIGTDNTARQEVEEERKRLDQRLRDQQFYTRSLIDDLLAFSRVGRAEIRRTSVQLGELVQDVIRGLEMVINARPIVWKIAPLPQVVGDPSLLKQVLAKPDRQRDQIQPHARPGDDRDRPRFTSRSNARRQREPSRETTA